MGESLLGHLPCFSLISVLQPTNVRVSGSPIQTPNDPSQNPCIQTQKFQQTKKKVARDGVFLALKVHLSENPFFSSSSQVSLIKLPLASSFFPSPLRLTLPTPFPTPTSKNSSFLFLKEILFPMQPTDP